MQVLGRHTSRLHPGKTEWQADRPHDPLDMDDGRHSVHGSLLRLEGPRLPSPGERAEEVPRVPRPRISDLCDSRHLLCSAHGDPYTLLEDISNCKETTAQKTRKEQHSKKIKH